MPALPAVADIAAHLDSVFAVERFPGETGGVYLPSPRPVARIGLALEPFPDLPSWVERERLNALFLHRPWRLEPQSLPANMGVVAYHLSFDETLTTGYNLRLANALHLTELETLGEKEGRPLGMIGNVPETAGEDFLWQVEALFGGREAMTDFWPASIRRVAVVGAMTAELVAEAAVRGADGYLTGQLRVPALAAVQQTGIAVCAVGHRRSEEWGLRALSGLLWERWAALEAVVWRSL